MSESFSTLLDKNLGTLDMQPGSIVSGVVLDIDKDFIELEKKVNDVVIRNTI